jgi:hypothetical protein
MLGVNASVPIGRGLWRSAGIAARSVVGVTALVCAGGACGGRIAAEPAEGGAGGDFTADAAEERAVADAGADIKLGPDAAAQREFQPQVDGGIRALVCAFDIDATLTCSRAADAVRACKDAGALLAVNTAELRSTALANKDGAGYVDWAALGFPTDGGALVMADGAFIFGMCGADGSCSTEFGGAPGDCEMCANCGAGCPTQYMGKAYGMSRIAEHYEVSDKTCIVLLDDLLSNTDAVEAFGYGAYFHGDCHAGWDGDEVYAAVYGYLTSAAFAHCRE